MKKFKFTKDFYYIWCGKRSCIYEGYELFVENETVKDGIVELFKIGSCRASKYGVVVDRLW